MPIRVVKQRSDRGNIKDLSKLFDIETHEPPTDEEMRLKKSYEYAEATKDENLKSSLGFIVMSNPGDKSAFPITVFRHREYISSLSKKMADKIERTKQELAACFTDEPNQMVRKSHLKQRTARYTILESGGLIKTASASKRERRSFKRVSL